MKLVLCNRQTAFRDGFYVTGETGNPAIAILVVNGDAAITAGSGNIVHVLGSSTASYTANGANLDSDR